MQFSIGNVGEPKGGCGICNYSITQCNRGKVDKCDGGAGIVESDAFEPGPMTVVGDAHSIFVAAQFEVVEPAVGRLFDNDPHRAVS